MIIQCPQCSTGYNIPDSTLGDKPRKMKCAKCKHVFMVTRRTEKPPEGYVEFTGAQKLPPEFAFLKASMPPKSAAPPAIPDLSTGGTFVGHPPSSPPEQPATPPPMPKMISRGQTVLGIPAAIVPGEEKPSRPAAPTPFIAGIPEEAYQQATSPAAKAAVAELRQGGGVPVGHSLPAETMFGGNSSAWEVESPMELGGYAVSAEPVHHGHQLMGKIIFGITVMLVAFFVFVAFRNGWSLSLSGLPEQIGFAFSGEALDEVPEAAENIEAMIVTKKVVTSSMGAYLSVAGEVINNNPGPRSHVIVRGRLYDGQGKLKGEVKFPCGRAIDDKELQDASSAGIQNFYMDKGQLHNCQIGTNDSRLFQIIFENVPDYYDAGFDVKVKVVAATAP